MRRLIQGKYRKWKWMGIIGIPIGLLFFLFPLDLSDSGGSTAVLDKNGLLLAARIAEDGQWRFNSGDSIPSKMETCILAFEDRYFYYHPGINVPALFRAVYLNLKHRRIVSGGSTITNQLIRAARKGKSRSLYEKVVENLLALRVELYNSKAEILRMYLSKAPFGGNVVGLEAAAWRYFGRSPENLSWAESATLAVLPNAPALIYPGKNHDLLIKKRNKLLKMLFDRGKMEAFEYELACMEELPERPQPLPRIAPHLLNKIISRGEKGKVVRTSLSRVYQEKCNHILEIHRQALQGNYIMNAAILVLDVKSNQVLCYAGNYPEGKAFPGSEIDMIDAKRSTGSTLKPFLFALMLQEGKLMPEQLLADVPLQIGRFRPENFTKQFSGAVPANLALARSLNVTAVRMLKEYGVQPLIRHLQDMGLNSINRSASHYGLTLILGGGESSLWELSAAYAGLARTLASYRTNSSTYFKNNYAQPSYHLNQCFESTGLSEFANPGAGAVWSTLEALTESNRPEENMSWEIYQSSRKIAWKTGTSYGFKDAWSIGVTPEYVVGVWVGNASGEGRPGLTGFQAAAPLMFDVFKMLPATSWFDPPYDDLMEVEVCRKSGYKASTDCLERDTVWVPSPTVKTGLCPYHTKIYLDKAGKYRVNAQCYPVSDMLTQSWFVLPPAMEWYYRRQNSDYQILPPYAPGCLDESSDNMEIIYPQSGTSIFIPKEVEGLEGFSIFEVVHRNPTAEVYWYMDNQLIGTTQRNHQMKIKALPGDHQLTVLDNSGEIKKLHFSIVN